MKINEYPSTTSLSQNDKLIVETGGGTKTIEIDDAILEQLDAMSEHPEVTHRNIFRGKNLGSEVSSEQITHIRDGSFKDIYVGDYWEIDGTAYRVADINYLSKDNDYIGNHLIILADNPSWLSAWDSSGSVSKGYAGCTLRTNYLSTIKNKIVSDFPNLSLIPYTTRLSNGISTSTKLTTYAYTSCDVELLSALMVYGWNPYSPITTGTWIMDMSASISSRSFQLAIFRLNPRMSALIEANEYKNSYWLSDIGTTSDIRIVNRDGSLNGSVANKTEDNGSTPLPISVRPYFAIG